jgi:hypothetical protein
MKLSAKNAGASAAIVLGLFASSLSLAQGGAPSSVSWKRATQSHDSTQCERTSSTVIDSEDGLQPGPYAKYLIHTGMNKADAIQAARSVDQSGRATAHAKAAAPTHN